MDAADRRTALAIFTVALAFRLALAMAFAHPIGDTPQYAEPARYISLGEGFLSGDPPTESLRRGPGYPVFLAGSFLLDGTYTGFAAIVAQLALDSVVAVLVFAVARTVFALPRPISALAGVFYALNPFQGYIAAGLQSEGLFTFLLMAGIALLAVGSLRDSAGHAAAAGVMLGLAALTRPIGLGFILVLIGVLAFRWALTRHRRAALIPLLLGAAAFLVIVPWTARNYAVAGELVPIQSGAGEVFYVTTLTELDQKNETELWPRYREDPVVVEALSGRYSPNASQALLVRAGIEKIRADPAAYVRSRLANYPYLFVYGGDFAVAQPVALGELARSGDLIGLMRKVGYALIFSILPLGLALAALFDRRTRTLPTLIVGLFWAYNVATLTVLWIEPRFYAPSVPILAVWAAAGIATVAAWRQSRWSRQELVEVDSIRP